jgi:hypothetical protein
MIKWLFTRNFMDYMLKKVNEKPPTIAIVDACKKG